MKAIASKPKTMSGLIPFSANTLTLPASSCKRLMHRMAGGRLKYREGQGKVVEVSAEPASQLSSITTNSCWQLDLLEMQSNHLGNLILLLETQQTGRSCAPNSCGQVREGPPFDERSQLIKFVSCFMCFYACLIFLPRRAEAFKGTSVNGFNFTMPCDSFTYPCLLIKDFDSSKGDG